jgi:hypothetical protein
VVAFGGSTHALIPLFAVGVFLCFTLSQAGMVRHWLRDHGPNWRVKLVINGTGAVVTGIVTLIVVVTKFPEGAWIVVLIVPLEVMLFAMIHRHYAAARREMKTGHPPPPHRVAVRMIIPVGQLNRAVTETVSYALAVGGPVEAIHVAVDTDAAEKLRVSWERWGCGVPLRIVPSPYREVIEPLVHTIEDLRREHPRTRIGVLLPELVPRHWWEEPLHNQFTVALQLALRHEEHVIIINVPVQLET